MKLSAVPFPKASFRYYTKVIILIALSVIFILTIFQPFGTAEFNHPYKRLLLAGYGGVIFVMGILYYGISELFISSKMKDSWNIINELLFLISNVFLSLVGCYLYYGILFSRKISLSSFVDFLNFAGSVAAIPVGVYLIFIYMQYKGVSHLKTSESVEKNFNSGSDRIALTGTSKNEKIELDIDDLLYIKSNDNYVIIYLRENGAIKKKMLRNTLNRIETMVEKSLIRCHRSFLVNPIKIQAINGNITNSKLRIDGSDIEIPVSRSKVHEFRDLVVTI